MRWGLAITARLQEILKPLRRVSLWKNRLEDENDLMKRLEVWRGGVVPRVQDA